MSIASAGRSAAVWVATACVIALGACGRSGQPGSGASANAHFVGRAACAECHEKREKEWAGSHHDLAMQEATVTTVLGDFRDTTFTYHEVTSTFFKRDGKYWAKTDGPDGKLHEYPIAYTYGVYPLQQYLIKYEDGRIQALNVCWDTRPKEDGGQRWFHLYPNENVDFRDILHWTGPYQNWNHMCAECHSTDVRKGYDAGGNTFNTVWSEIDVSCETCHGPGSAHVKWAKSGGKGAEANMGLVVRLREQPAAEWKFDLTTGVAKRDVPRTDHSEIETCARCHARRGTFSEAYTPGKPLAQTHRLALLEPGLYEPDGQIKDEVYEYGSFLQSKMYAAGVTCTDCHDPHTLKTAGGNLTCAKCHLPTKYDAVSHHHHQEGTAASQCVSCHAPTKNYMVVHARHDHSYRVPRPDLTAKIGTPNACSGCHAERGTEWAVEAAAKWWGTAKSSLPHYGEVIDAGRKRKAGAGAGLVKLIGDATQPAIVRASAVELLAENSASAGDVVAALEGAARDADPQVRAAAAREMARVGEAAIVVRVCAPLLGDPVRQVRMDAARAMAKAPADAMTLEQQAARARGLEEYRSAEMTNADRGESHLNLGLVAQELGDAAAAEREYKEGIRVSPAFSATYVNLADLYRGRGDEKLVEQTLRAGLEKSPKDAGLRHALGLALVRQKKLEDALRELERSVAFEPGNARYAYVYAVALDSAGRQAEAVGVLRKAHDQDPGDAEVLAALVSYCRDAGAIAEALKYADELVALRPGDEGVVKMREELKGIKK